MKIFKSKIVIIFLILLAIFIVIYSIDKYINSIEDKKLAYCFYSLDKNNERLEYSSSFTDSTKKNLQNCKKLLQKYDKKSPVEFERLPDMPLETSIPKSILLNNGDVLILGLVKNNAQYFSYNDKRFYKITKNIFKKEPKDNNCIFKEPILLPDGKVYYFNQLYDPEKKIFNNADSGYALKLKELNANVNSTKWLKNNDLKLIRAFDDGKILFKKGKSGIILVDPFDIKHFKPATLGIKSENIELLKLHNDKILLLEETSSNDKGLNALNIVNIFDPKTGKIKIVKDINWSKEDKTLEIDNNKLLILKNDQSIIVDLINDKTIKFKFKMFGNPYLLNKSKIFILGENQCSGLYPCTPLLFDLNKRNVIILNNAKTFCDNASVTVLKNRNSVLVAGGSAWAPAFSMDFTANKAFLVTLK